MLNMDNLSCYGFTLAEVVVSLLLLSIVAIGSFKTFHLSQSSSNLSLVKFQQLQIQQQLQSLNKLRQSYSNISADNEYELLNCLIEQHDSCTQTP